MKFVCYSLINSRYLEDDTERWTALKNNKDMEDEYRKDSDTDSDCPGGTWRWGEENEYPWDYIEKPATCSGKVFFAMYYRKNSAERK